MGRDKSAKTYLLAQDVKSAGGGRMNREEAIKFFELQTQDEQALIDGINLNPDDFVFGAEGPEQYINDCQNNIDAYETAISAIRGPQPDPITGLVPCGCGGKAVDNEGIDYGYGYKCQKCGIATMAGSNRDCAKEDWNTAMGWKGGAE
jgi:hypothetical protein